MRERVCVCEREMDACSVVYVYIHLEGPARSCRVARCARMDSWDINHGLGGRNTYARGASGVIRVYHKVIMYSRAYSYIYIYIYIYLKLR